MAVVTDNLTFLPSYQAFERPPQSVSQYSLIPRGLRRFFFQDDVSAKPVNDQIDVFLTATLPSSFAYILRAVSLQLTSPEASDWQPTCVLRMLNHIPGQPLGTSEEIAASLHFMSSSSTAFRTIGATEPALQLFSGPVWSSHQGTITFRIQMANIAAAVSGTAFLISHCEFLEYDLAQAQRFWVNTPSPVIRR